MKIAIGADHGAYDLKCELVKFLEEEKYEFKDFGCYSADSVNYPDIAKAVAKSVADEEFNFGIMLCTTGMGVSMCCNKVNGIRAALCTEIHGAEMTRKHNNANVLCMGATFVKPELAKEIVKVFVNTEFEGGRHQTRVDLMMDIEKEN